MPSRFYYSPVRGVEGQESSGIAAGIESGISEANRNLEQRRQNDRQAEKDRRQTLFDDMEIDEFLIENRGGRGPARSQDVPVRGRVESSSMPRFFPDKVPGVGLQDRGEVPEFGGYQPTIQRTDPRYREVGGGLGYVMTPGAQEEETYLRDRGRQEAERGDRIERAGSIAAAITGGAIDQDSPDFGRRAVEMSEDGFDAFDFLPERPEGYEPITRADYFRVRGRDPETGRSVDPRATGGARDGRMNEAQAMDYLLDRYAVTDDQGNVLDYSMSEQDMLSNARAIANGQDVELPPAGEAAGGTGKSGGNKDRPLTEADINTARQQLSRFPRSSWAEKLKGIGATEEQIQQITGG